MLTLWRSHISAVGVPLPQLDSGFIVEELAKGAVEPVVEGLKAAAGALWERHVKMEELEIETIKSQLEAAKSPEFGSQ